MLLFGFSFGCYLCVECLLESLLCECGYAECLTWVIYRVRLRRVRRWILRGGRTLWLRNRRQVANWSCFHLCFHIMHNPLYFNAMHVLQKFYKVLLLARAIGSRLATMLGHACTKWVGWKPKLFWTFKLASFGATFCENYWKTKLYIILSSTP